MGYDSRYDLEGMNLRPASAWEEEEGRGRDEVAGDGIHRTQAPESSKGSGDKSIPGRVGAGMARIAIDEYPLLPFDSLNWTDLGLVGFLFRNQRQLRFASVQVCSEFRSQNKQ